MAAAKGSARSVWLAGLILTSTPRHTNVKEVSNFLNLRHQCSSEQ